MCPRYVTDSSPQALVTAEWAPVSLAEVSQPLLADDRLSFVAVLVDDDGLNSVGVVAALTAAPAEADELVQPIADQLNGGSAMKVTARRWQRGGRSQSDS